MARLKKRGAVLVPPEQVFLKKGTAEKIAALTRTINTLERGIISTANGITHQENSIAQDKQKINQYRDAILALRANPGQFQLVIERLEGLLQDVQRNLSGSLDHLQYLQNKVPSDTARLETHRQKLVELQTESANTASKTAAEILAEIASHPLVAPSNRTRPRIWLNQDDGNRKYIITFRTRPVKCTLTATEDLPHLLIQEGRPFVILPPMSVELSLYSTDIRVFATPRNGRWTSFNRSAPHPHILRDNAPCLGDFASNIAESHEIMDFLGVLDILQVFLENATYTDGAGYNWLRWLPEGQSLAPHFNHTYDPEAQGQLQAFVYTANPDGGLLRREARHVLERLPSNAVVFTQIHLDDIADKCTPFPIFIKLNEPSRPTSVFLSKNDRAIYDVAPWRATANKIAVPDGFFISESAHASA